MAEPRSPIASSDAVRATMRANRGRDTGPELAVRRALHARGLRYRVHHPLPFNRRRRADIAFTRAKVAVFIDGCFWHGCPEHGTIPRRNSPYWSVKITTNRQRDADTTRRLEEDGWAVLRFWEHEAVDDVVARCLVALRARWSSQAARVPSIRSPRWLSR